MNRSTAISRDMYDSVIYHQQSRSFLRERAWEKPAFLQKSGFSHIIFVSAGSPQFSLPLLATEYRSSAPVQGP